MKVRYEPAREHVQKHGCSVEEERVKFPRAVVEKYRKMYPPTFTFYARDPQFDKTIPQDSPVIVTASSAPDILDPVTGQERRATSGDIARIAHLINELPGYDIFSISTLADDAPARPVHTLAAVSRPEILQKAAPCHHHRQQGYR